MRVCVREREFVVYNTGGRQLRALVYHTLTPRDIVPKSVHLSIYLSMYLFMCVYTGRQDGAVLPPCIYTCDILHVRSSGALQEQRPRMWRAQHKTKTAKKILKNKICHSVRALAKPLSNVIIHLHTWAMANHACTHLIGHGQSISTHSIYL